MLYDKQHKDNENYSSFSVRKIPLSDSDKNNENSDKKESDKVKIIEMCNLIDEWEKTLLFSENGFFSLKGKAVQNKTEEFINELNSFINSKISEIPFSLIESKEAAVQIKNLKIENIKREMLNYEAKELFEWEIGVFENALSSNIQKAVLYKNDFRIVQKCFKNALIVLKLLSEKEKWNDKIYKFQKDKLISDFYSSIIESFQSEKDIRFAIYYEQYKKILSEEKRRDIEKVIDDLKQNITAYNWAKEISSYNQDDEEIKKEVKAIHNQDLEKSVNKFLEIIKSSKKRNEEKETNYNAEKNWDDVIALTENEPDKALLNINLNQKKEIINAQIDYIKKMTKDGFIETDRAKYTELIKELVENPYKFRLKPISEYRNLLSLKDFDFINNLKQEEDNKFISYYYDFSFILERLKLLKIKDINKIYDTINLYISSLDCLREANSEKTDIEKRNKIIDSIFERITYENKDFKKKE